MSINSSNWATRRRYLVFCSLGLCALLQSCLPSAERSELRISGSSTISPVMDEITRRYSIYNPDVQISVSAGGSIQGISDVREGESDIGMVSRSLKEEETDLEQFIIAHDGVSLLVHQDNPVKALDQQQVLDIYTGTVDNWQAVGGNQASIEVVSKGENHATFSLFAEYFSLPVEEIESARILGDNEDVMQAVLDNPDAIGYVSIGAAEYNIIHGMPLKLLPLEGVAATIENVSDGEFPLSRPLNLVTSQFPAGEQKELIEFALSQEVQDIITEQAFVPVASGER